MGREILNNAKRLKQVKKYLFDNRKTLTEDGFSDVVDSIAKELVSWGYEKGWGARNHVSRITSTLKRIRMRKDFSDLYSLHMEAKGNVEGTKPFTINQLQVIDNLIKDWM